MYNSGTAMRKLSRDYIECCCHFVVLSFTSAVPLHFPLIFFDNGDYYHLTPALTSQTELYCHSTSPSKSNFLKEHLGQTVCMHTLFVLLKLFFFPKSMLLWNASKTMTEQRADIIFTMYYHLYLKPMNEENKSTHPHTINNQILQAKWTQFSKWS